MYQIIFQIAYEAAYGDRLRIVGSTEPKNRVFQEYLYYDGAMWRTELSFAKHTEALHYHYEVVRGTEVIRREGGGEHYLQLHVLGKMQLLDRWCVEGVASEYFRTAFTQCIYADHYKSNPTDSVDEPLKANLTTWQNSRLTLHALPAPKGFHWAVIGSSGHLGAWDLRASLRLEPSGAYAWSTYLDASDDLCGTTEYKYILVDDNDALNVRWETGANRTLPHLYGRVVVNDYDPQISLPHWRGAGIVLPVFSLRSHRSMGIGDFGDLRRLVAWVSSVGMHAIQILPVNDTTRDGRWGDSYPYSAVSVFALHPIYIDATEWEMFTAYKQCRKEGERLNALAEVDYEAVWQLKQRFWLLLYQEIGSNILSTPSFIQWQKDNHDWLQPYATHCAERDTALALRKETTKDLQRLAAYDLKQRLSFYAFQQYLLHRQLKNAHEEAQRLKVILKGDIPIGVSPDSVSVKTHPMLFHRSQSAGAPPDAFARDGQNWGFPTYNWEQMAHDNYAWWRKRKEHMEQYYDAFRIDHVLGFFRIWSIPRCQQSGMLGHFYPALPLTQSEIHGFGMSSDVAAMAVPHLTPHAYRKFVERYPQAKTFFQEIDGRYEVRHPWTEQQHIARELSAQPALRAEMMRLATEVLFIEDEEQPHTYHPRINAMDTSLFSTLTQAEQEAFHRLHNDFFYVRHNHFWKLGALKKLPAVVNKEGSMLPCAEDLGMVPACVPEVLERLHILSLQIQTMPKTYGHRFDDTADYPYRSVATIATHDMPPFRLWWQLYPEAAQHYWHNILGEQRPCPKELPVEGSLKVVETHMKSPSMLCMLGWQDWSAITSSTRYAYPEKEQINHPDNPQQKWRYRMHIAIEDLYNETAFNELILQLCRTSNR